MMTNEEAIAKIKRKACFGGYNNKNLCQWADEGFGKCEECENYMAIEALKQKDFADFILHWLADSYGCICDYNFGDYLYERDTDYCEENCEKNTEYDCWKMFLDLKFEESLKEGESE